MVRAGGNKKMIAVEHAKSACECRVAGVRFASPILPLARLARVNFISEVVPSRSIALKRLCAGISCILAALLLGGCDKTTEAPAVQPVAVSTKSGIDMVVLPEGTFLMGSDSGNADESPVHRVHLGAFAIDKNEVTQEMFDKVQLPNPSHWQDPHKPAESLRWRDAKAFCNERSLLEGLKPCYDEKTAEWTCDYSASGYRLPTEAEWEYAARAGDNPADDPAAADKLRAQAWYADNSDKATHAVGEKKPNAWGLNDMYGNVSEWCEDVYSPTYYKESPADDPHGPPSPAKDVKRVMRGGNWSSSAAGCRPTARQAQRTGNSDACFHTDYCGFRCVRKPSAEELAKLSPPTK